MDGIKVQLSVLADAAAALRTRNAVMVDLCQQMKKHMNDLSSIWMSDGSEMIRMKFMAFSIQFENSREVISSHARKIISSRLAPAFPVNDGKQTPMRGHAVFIAQHATGCCCRGCLAKWHNIPPGRELSETEISSIVNVIVSWILEQREKKPVPHTPDLF